jgi:hypothetical protein
MGKDIEMSQDHSLWADAVTIAEITQLRKDLAEAKAYNATRTAEVLAATQHAAEREAEIAKLRECLEKIRRTDEDGEWFGAPYWQARKALSTPPSTSYLEQWERANYGEPVTIEEPDYHYEAMGCGLEDRNITDRYEAMRHGWYCAMDRVFEQIPDEALYARKEK